MQTRRMKEAGAYRYLQLVTVPSRLLRRIADKGRLRLTLAVPEGGPAPGVSRALGSSGAPLPSAPQEGRERQAHRPAMVRRRASAGPSAAATPRGILSTSWSGRVERRVQALALDGKWLRTGSRVDEQAGVDGPPPAWRGVAQERPNPASFERRYRIGSQLAARFFSFFEPLQHVYD